MRHLHTIRQQCDKAGNQANLARKLGIAASHLSDVMSRKRDVSPALAMKLENACGINGLKLLTQQVEHQWLEFKKNTKEKESQ